MLPQILDLLALPSCYDQPEEVLSFSCLFFAHLSLLEQNSFPFGTFERTSQAPQTPNYYHCILTLPSMGELVGNMGSETLSSGNLAFGSIPSGCLIPL